MQFMKKLSEKTKKYLSAVISIFLVAALISGSLIYSQRKKDFSHYEKSAIAMGTVITAKTYGENTAPTNEAVIKIIQQLEDEISWREAGSKIEKLNSEGVVFSNDLSELFKICGEISEKSEGAFDLSVGAVSRLWDIGGDNQRIPSEKEIKKALETVDYKKIAVSGTEISTEKGQFIDLGAVGKGFACSLIYQYLSESSVEGAVVSVGGSIVAFGNRNKAEDKWRIAVRHPRNENAIIGTILLSEGFVSTSGDYEKYFEENGVRYHHLLDAKTGYPAESDLISVTIVCNNGLLSDALSTACFVLGSEKGKALAEEYGVGAIFVDKEEKITTIGEVDFQKN